MKILLITSSTDTNTGDASCTATPTRCSAGIAYWDWVNTLQREGVPFDSLVTTPVPGDPAPAGASTFSALPALSSTATDGTQVANYEGVVVAGSGLQGMSTAQWDTLQTFEHQFSVRQVTAYAVPSGDYGMNAPNPANGGALTPGQLSLTADGSGVFPYLKQVSVDPSPALGTWAYEATPLPGANVDTLISGPNGSTLLGIYTSSDGRQTMFQTFNENQNYLQSQLLRHGELVWLARNTYFGDQRNYVEMDIDDTFTPDDAWDAMTTPGSLDYNEADDLRMNPGDVATAATWEANNNFRMDQLFNMGGTAAYQSANGPDPLLQAFQAACTSVPNASDGCGPGNGGASKSYADSFGWISHTYDTPYLDVGCATQNYIEAELNENSNVAAESGSGGTGGLGLTEDTTGATALGAEDPHVFVPGNHSGFADLVPGNPATVDPPILETTTPVPVADATSTLPAGTYEYAVTDQFVNSVTPTAPQSSADVTSPVTVAPGQSVPITWQAICHAADYLIYRAPVTVSGTTTTVGAWSLIGTVSTPFSATVPFTSTGNTLGSSGDPTSATDVTGGGELVQTYTDASSATGTATPAGWIPPTTQGAVESPWEQNPYFGPALKAVGITAVGDDGSKPYPNPADDPFGIGVGYTGAEYAADSTFLVPGTSAQVVPRHPINIYYNASTDYQELNEYQSIYGAGGSSPDATVCPGGTCTWSDVVNQVVSGMFGFMMDNDPRPSYVHQTNIMGSVATGSEGTDDLPPASYTPQPGGGPDEPAGTGKPTTTGDGVLYQVLDPLLFEYQEYFNSTAPFVQLTQQAIANLLAEQQAWSASSAVNGYIEGNVVTVNFGSAAIQVPLTGTNVGTQYAGSWSGWTDALTGTHTYTARSAWPAEPTNPVVLTPPGGPAPGGKPAVGGNPIPPVAPVPPKSTAPVYYVAVQVAPKTVSMKKGTATVSLKCEAKNGKPAKNHFCTGTFKLTVMGKTVSHSFRIKATKTARIAIKLPKKALLKASVAAAHGHHITMHGVLAISTKQPSGPAKLTRGTLKIRT